MNKLPALPHPEHARAYKFALFLGYKCENLSQAIDKLLEMNEFQEDDFIMSECEFAELLSEAFNELEAA